MSAEPIIYGLIFVSACWYWSKASIWWPLANPSASTAVSIAGWRCWRRGTRPRRGFGKAAQGNAAAHEIAKTIPLYSLLADKGAERRQLRFTPKTAVDDHGRAWR